MNANTLSLAMGCSLSKAKEMVDAYNNAMLAANIVTVNRAAMFAAQIGHESNGLQWMEELASGAAYEGRKDLGNIYPGDGRLYKGSGPIQLTGRANFTKFSKWCHERGYVDSPYTFVRSPHLVRDNPKWGFLAASWYWTVERPNLNAQSDRGDIYAATRSINGGLNGINDRIARWNKCKRLGGALLPTKKTTPTTPKKEEDWFTMATKKELEEVVAAALNSDNDLTARYQLTTATAKAIGWGDRPESKQTMTGLGMLQTALRMSADAAKGVKRTERDLAQIADDVEALNSKRG